MYLPATGSALFIEEAAPHTMPHPVLAHDAAPAAQPAATHRFMALTGVFIFALLPISCSATHQQVQPDGDVVLRSGPTTLGWVGIVGPTMLFAVLLAFAVVVVVGGLGEELAEAARLRRFLPAAGVLLVCLFAAGVVALMGWAIATYTVLKYHTTVATASRSADELSVTRSRLIGHSEVRRWAYREITRIEFEYVPGTSGDGGTPPQGVVSVRTADGKQARIFDGSPCPARDLADAVTSATGVPIRVEAGPRDISSWSALTTQLRCGIAQPFHPKDWSDYPAEVSRVLDLPSLWHWPWLLPFLASQLVLIALLWSVDKRWLDPKASTALRAAVWVPVVFAAAALHLLAVRSFESWPAALAVFALISMNVAASRLGFTFRAFLRRWGTST